MVTEFYDCFMVEIRLKKPNNFNRTIVMRYNDSGW